MSASRLRIVQGLMVVAAAASLLACRKDTPKGAEKPAPAAVKKSPAEIKQLADSATQSLEELKPLLANLGEKYKALHVMFDPLPPDMPNFSPTREKFNGADEGVGRMNAKVAWLTGRIDAAVKAGDDAELEEIKQSIANTTNDVPEASKIALELIHEVMPFTRLAEQYEAKRTVCETDKAVAPSPAAAAAALSKKPSTH